MLKKYISITVGCYGVVWWGFFKQYGVSAEKMRCESESKLPLEAAGICFLAQSHVFRFSVSGRNLLMLLSKSEHQMSTLDVFCVDLSSV